MPSVPRYGIRFARAGAPGAPAPVCAPGMARQLWGASPLWAVMCGTTSRRQLRHREVLWEGSPRQDLGIDEQKPDIRPVAMG